MTPSIAANDPAHVEGITLLCCVVMATLEMLVLKSPLLPMATIVVAVKLLCVGPEFQQALGFGRTAAFDRTTDQRTLGGYAVWSSRHREFRSNGTNLHRGCRKRQRRRRIQRYVDKDRQAGN